jgi:ATP-dependent DNA helicase RecQ
MERMQKMIDYISEEDVCRSSYLLEYFGQKDSADCGNCDICRASKNKAAGPVDTAARLTSFINVDKAGKYALDDVIMRFGTATSSSSDDYLAVLRRLIDEGTVPPPVSR